MSLNIILFNTGVLNPGDVLEGKVVCIFNSNKDIRGIRLKIRGREHTSWEKQESYYDNNAKQTRFRTVHFSGDEKFFTVQETLRGEGVITLGKHEFPFRMLLPKDLPSSYNGAHGHIRYYVKANVDIPMAPDYEDEKKFIVISPINFNCMLNYIELNPTQYQDETNLCCCCCASDPISVDAYLEKEAFVIGEKIRIKIHITNMSNTSIEFVSVQLARTVVETCKYPRHDEKSETDVIISDSNTGVGAHGDRDYSFELQVPHSLELANFVKCELFSQSFELKIEVGIPGCHSNIDIDVPVALGHIAAHSPQYTENVHLTAANRPFVPVPTAPQPYPPGDAAPPYPTGPNAFPVPPTNPGTIGFAVPDLPPPFPGAPANNVLPGIHKPNGVQAPYPPGPPSQPSGSSAPYPVANAPSDESAPSAPSKAELANGDDFIFLEAPDENDSSEPAPPSYQDAVRKPK